MAITSLPAQEFAQDVYKALSATENGPVYITDDGIETHVLLSYADYRHLLAQKNNIASRLEMHGGCDVEFEPLRVDIHIRPADFK
ncbi:type II toxin-antitoxin system Phd/YefM family antitoxin [Herbaspirillum huttiense]|uniref:type II toxin-antitoxin system Phd/YefM family antitoxin n=1 Tax=Herbaspirillum huttiense TaxID=863372 RepID=UPI001066F786|nr:type II toxin-antitoxin system Phd/YefM family antitoxin [Herbaspirillum huttiense]QBP77626.1 type II toxin-antitoxin system Phd/YefM family antitoxin [Herbaspirillum huttiense]